MNEDNTPQTGLSEKSDLSHPSSALFPSPSQQRWALLIVCLVMFIDLLGFGIVLPLLPQYATDFLSPLLPDPNQHPWWQGAILGALMASFSAMQFVFAPIWGRISDRAGRRPFLLLGLLGSVVFYGLFGFASDWGREEGRQALGLILLFLSRIGAGIAGATVSTAQAVIADCTRPEQRGRGMALIGMAFGIGLTFGPIIGAGALSLLPQPGAPGYAAGLLSALALVLAVVLMPETVRVGAQGSRRGWLNLNSIQQAFQIPTLGTLILTFFLSTLAFATFEPTLALLTRDVLGYAETPTFLIFAFTGLVMIVTQGGLYQVLARHGVTEISFILLGIVLMILGLGQLGYQSRMAALFGHSTGGLPRLLPLFLESLTLAVVGFAFVIPSLQALISRRADPTRQGEILGVNQSINAVARILGPGLGPILYYLWPTHVLPYVSSVVLLLLVLFLALRVKQI
jgi:MFS family permease